MLRESRSVRTHSLGTENLRKYPEQVILVWNTLSPVRWNKITFSFTTSESQGITRITLDYTFQPLCRQCQERLSDAAANCRIKACFGNLVGISMGTIAL